MAIFTKKFFMLLSIPIVLSLILTYLEEPQDQMMYMCKNISRSFLIQIGMQRKVKESLESISL
jgi:hypothetical protein